jgi:hypothetical protein
MRRALIAFGCFWITCHGALDLPYARPMPDQPVPVPHRRSAPVLAGTRSFRPVDPLPWTEENRKVTPTPGSMPSMPGMQHHHGEQ